LVFAWPSLTPPQPDLGSAKPGASLEDEAAAALARVNDRVFVVIAGVGDMLTPAERLRSIYPRYVEAQPAAGPDGLAILPFRAGTPYQGEDLIYVGSDPAQFFARCTRPLRVGPGTCMHDSALDAA